jgi:hypothetical protein
VIVSMQCFHAQRKTALFINAMNGRVLSLRLVRNMRLTVWHQQLGTSRSHRVVRGQYYDFQCDPRVHRVNAGRGEEGGASNRPQDDRASVWEKLASFVGNVEYSGDWNLSPEWYGTQGDGWGRNGGETIFDEASSFSGRVTVTAHPASPVNDDGLAEWRVLRFNNTTRQSVVRLVDGKADAGCLATEYLKSVVAVVAAVMGARKAARSMPALCIGVGGGSMVMFLNKYFPEMDIDAVEIDPVVVAAAVSHMGADFEMLVQDANDFIGSPASRRSYELIYMDAFDGDDCVPEALCQEEFAARLACVLSETGTLIVNLHENDPNWMRTAKTFSDAVGGEAFTCTCKTQGNVILCASRVALGSGADLRALASGTYFKRNLPFRCGDRISQGLSRVV